MTMTLRSDAFPDGGPIPDRHTALGLDLSPPLAVDGVPPGTRELALLVLDPDVPHEPWVHWLLYGLPPDTRRLPEGVTRALNLPGGVRQGRNGYGKIGWGGPCPPVGPAHRYVFTLLALDAGVGLRGGATRAELERAMAGHIRGTATLQGWYARPAE